MKRLTSLLLCGLLALCAPAAALSEQNHLPQAIEDVFDYVEEQGDETRAVGDELILVTEDEGTAETLQDEAGGILVRDFAGLMTDGKRQALEDQAQAVSAQYGCNVYVLTVDSTGGAGRREYAKRYYNDNGLGSGSWRNGVLFLVAMESREYVTITYGRDPNDSSSYGIGIYAFSDYGVAQMEDRVVPYLSDGDYDRAFATYVEICESYLKQYTETGEPFDVYNAPRSKTIPLLITIFVPLLVALVVCMIFRGQMKTAKQATQADDYVPADGFRLTQQLDQYTHTSRSVRHIERSSDSGGGGGSSVDSGGFGGSSGGHF